jgi:hypothetical protein
MPDKEQTLPQDPAFSRQVLEMLTVANEFCLFLEKADEYSKKFILSYLQKVCPLIYIKASLMPEVILEEDDVADHFVTEEEWEAMFNTLHIKFGADDIYYFQDHHEKTNNDPIRASMAENFTDIYQDMKDFVLLYQKPHLAAKNIAVKEFKNLFETRFGYRLVNVQQAVHYLLYTEGEKGELLEEGF